MSTQKEKTTGDELLLKLHEQFSENQNHHQGLFIQLLIALFALFGVFGYVLTHTEGLELTIPQFTPLIVFNFIENDSKELFKPIVLSGTACAVSLILLFLNIFVLNHGYAYRRDQYINQKIREKYLSNDGYKDIFGVKYKANDKGLLDYLPDFYNLFFYLFTICQIFVFIIVFYLENNQKECYKTLWIIPYLTLITIILSVGFYLKTYCKYSKRITKEFRIKSKVLSSTQFAFSLLFIVYLILSIIEDKSSCALDHIVVLMLTGFIFSCAVFNF